MNHVIIATWQDNRNTIVDQQVIDAEYTNEEILDFISAAKQEYGHSVLAFTETYAAFSDGTRVSLQLHRINHLETRWTEQPLLELEE